MGDVNGAPGMRSELVSCGAMTTGQSSKEPLMKEPNHEKVTRKEQLLRQQNPEEEDDEEDQLTLSHLFMNKALPSSASPPLVTPLDCVTPPSRKRLKLSSPVMEKAKAIQAGLDPTHPSVIKILSRSHVTKGFWLGLPVDFCTTYLPNYDITIKLEDEDGLQYDTKFLAVKGRLSGGWRRFSLAHHLQEGDAVVFHLVTQYAFKVYIVRKNNMDHERQLESAVEVEDVSTSQKKGNLLDLMIACLEESGEIDGHTETHPSVLQGQGVNFTSESREERQLETTTVKDGQQEKNYALVVEGSSSEKGSSLRAFEEEVPRSDYLAKYYELCRARKSDLHGGLRNNINRNLAAEVISETAKIADAIRACSLSTSQSDLHDWVQTLEGFKKLGMDVDFLLVRAKELLRLTIQHKDCNQGNRYSEVIKEEKHISEEIASLQKRLIGLKEARLDLRIDRENLEAHFRKCNLSFQEMAKGPW